VLVAFAMLPVARRRQPHPPAIVPWLVALLDALLVAVTAQRKPTADPRLDFRLRRRGDVTVLVLGGPTVALVATRARSWPRPGRGAADPR
jgi:hypothetical protein